MRGEGEGLRHRQEVVQELGVTTLQLAVIKVSLSPSHWQIITHQTNFKDPVSPDRLGAMSSLVSAWSSSSKRYLRFLFLLLQARGPNTTVPT